MMASDRVFKSTSAAGLDLGSPVMRLWQKAKKLGVWDPRDIDMTRDIEDWRRLSEPERDVLLRLTALFLGGEESVTVELLPLIMVIAREGRLEEEIFLTSFLFEEAKHVEFFRRFFDEIALDARDLSGYHTPSWRTLFYHELPSALERLRLDPSPIALAEASVTYNMVVEGILAETGYHGYHSVLERRAIMPGMRAGIALVKRDESRHIAYGVYLLSRLLAEHGDSVWHAIERRMGQLLQPAVGVIDELFGAYEEMPFGLRADDFTAFALSQFETRLHRIEAARGRRVEELIVTDGASEE
jgi:ribonucleoside-diphosphate reductase beta chain